MLKPYLKTFVVFLLTATPVCGQDLVALKTATREFETGVGFLGDRIRFAGQDATDFGNDLQIKVVDARANYGKISLNKSENLGTGAKRKWAYAVAPNRDIFVIDTKPPSQSGDRVRLTIRSPVYGYRGGDYAKHYVTALEATDANWSFLVAPNRELVAVNRKGNNGKTEVHMLASRRGGYRKDKYSYFSGHFSTGLHTTDANWEFMMAANRDLIAVNRKGSDDTVDIHVLTAASNYRTFGAHHSSVLHTVDDNWDFALDINRDVIAMNRKGTDGKTELHRLSAAHEYKAFTGHHSSVLSDIDKSWTLAIFPPGQ